MSLPGPIEAVVIVALVLVEAVVLYYGYGTLERVVGPSMKSTIEGT